MPSNTALAHYPEYGTSVHPSRSTQSGAVLLPEFLLEPTHEHVEFRGNGANGIWLAEIDPGPRQQIHRVIASTGFQQIQIAIHCVLSLARRRRADVLHQPRGR